MVVPEIAQQLYYSSPEYLRGYEDGYKCAKEEMLELVRNLNKQVKALEAFHECTSTVTTKEV